MASWRWEWRKKPSSCFSTRLTKFYLSAPKGDGVEFADPKMETHFGGVSMSR